MVSSGVSYKLILVTFLCAVFCFAWSTEDMFHLQIPASVTVELRKQAEICGQENGVPSTNLKKILDKTLPNDEPNKKFFQCVIFNTGYTDKDGHFIVDKMINLNIMNGTKDDLVKTIENCNKVSKETDTETFFATANCIHEDYVVTVQN